jgi:5-methylcytosine-specific restriction endonuclease McrA
LFWKYKRRFRELFNGGEFTKKEWADLVKKFNFTCPACYRKEPEIKLTADHIIPVSKGGTNYILNIQPLCESCNKKKNAKIIYYQPSS